VTDLAMLLTIVVVGVDLTYLMLAWPRFPYSSGAAALLCVGAFIGRNIDDYALRCVLAMTVSGLLVLRLCSGLFPATFPASHGLVGNFDAAVLAAQILLCGALVITAFLRTDNESPRSSSPTAGASGQTL
jgi:hypothetical protein